MKNLFLYVRSTVFYLGMAISLLIFSPLSVIMRPLPFYIRYKTISQWARFQVWWLRVTCGVKYQVEGLENIPDSPCIVMSNHQSAWETLALQFLLPPQVWVLKRELLHIPIYGWGLAAMEPIAIDRGAAIKSFRQIVEQGKERLAKGLWVIIYPEGTRVAPGEEKKYLPGGGLLAERTGLPILPVAHNSGHFWPRNSILKYSGTITMKFGPLISSAGKKANTITKETENVIRNLL